MSNVPSVDELITESKNEKKLIKKKRIIKVLSSLIGILILVLLTYTYFISKYSSLNNIRVIGNQNISEVYVKERINSIKSKYSIFDFGFNLSAEIEKNPLIKSVKFEYPKNNEFNVYIDEFKVLAYLNDINSVLLENGKLYSFNEYESISISELIYVTGYTDELAYNRLALSLIELSDSTKLMISEIIQEEKSYDVYYAKLIMYDGITVYSSLITLKVLEDYASIRGALNPEHKCIAIDEIKSVPYSFSCYP
jgi:cell division protein FtsQ